MAKKRKQHQWRNESSDAKRRRSHPYHVGETSRANDGTPREEIVGATAFRETVLEIKDAIQVKAETEKEIDKLKEKGKKYEEEIRILKEEQIKLKEVQQDLISQIQEMQRRLAEVDHYRASPSQRSQPSESRLNLRIENMVASPNYKKETVTTEDGSGRIKVAMYHGNSPIPPEHPLASAKVHLVVIEGEFNEEEPKKDSWSIEEFEKNLTKRRKGIRRLVENGTFELIGGRCDHEGAKIMDNSQQKEVKLGVRVTMPTGVRVLEGVSNPFKVQESKTKPKVHESKTKASKKKDKKPSPPVPTPNLEQPTSTHATQHDRGKHTEFLTDDTGEDNGLSYPPATVQQMVEGNGQANGNGHRSSQQIPTETLLVPTSTYLMQHGQGPVNLDEQQIQGLLQKSDRGKHTEFRTNETGEDSGLSYQSATVPQMVEGNGQAQNGNGQNYRYGFLEQFSWQSTSSNPLQHGQDYGLPPPSTQNPLQAAVNQPLLAYGQDQYTCFPNASSQPAIPNLFSPSNDFQSPFNLSDFFPLQDETQMQETNWSFRYGRALLQWDNPHVELKKHWNFLDQLMPLYSTKSRFYTESFLTTSFMDKAHKLLACISSGDSVSKMITSGMSQATQTPQRRGVLIRSIGPYDSEDEPPVKKQRHAKYQLRFVNRVCSDYYTWEQIKSEDGTFLKVALYDENNLVVTFGRLSSASVEVVLLHGDFNAEGQDYWTREEFSTCLVHPQSAKEPPALGGYRVLALTDGEADLGNVNFRTSSFHARTGKFKMGVVITNVREENVQEGITSPFVVRVRLGEEPSRHPITSLESLLRVRVKLPNQVCGALERDAKENVSASSALHDQSLQVISVLGTSTASERPPESSQPQVISVLGASTASDRPPEQSSQGVESSAPSALLKEWKCAEDVKDEVLQKFGDDTSPSKRRKQALEYDSDEDMEDEDQPMKSDSEEDADEAPDEQEDGYDSVEEKASKTSSEINDSAGKRKAAAGSTHKTGLPRTTSKSAGKTSPSKVSKEKESPDESAKVFSKKKKPVISKRTPSSEKEIEEKKPSGPQLAGKVVPALAATVPRAPRSAAIPAASQRKSASGEGSTGSTDASMLERAMNRAVWALRESLKRASTSDEKFK